MATDSEQLPVAQGTQLNKRDSDRVAIELEFLKATEHVTPTPTARTTRVSTPKRMWPWPRAWRRIKLANWATRVKRGSGSSDTIALEFRALYQEAPRALPCGHTCSCQEQRVHVRLSARERRHNKRKARRMTR